jgi:hypothetical protein
MSLAAEVLSNSLTADEPPLLSEETDSFPLEEQVFGLNEPLILLPQVEPEFPSLKEPDNGHIEVTEIPIMLENPQMSLSMVAELPSHSDMTEPQLFTEEINLFPIEEQDFGLMEPISILPGGMDTISIDESYCIPPIEVPESPVLLEEAKVFTPIVAEKSSANNSMLDAQEMLIIFPDIHLPSVSHFSFLQLLQPQAAFSWVKAVVYPCLFICPFLILLYLLALPSPLTLWTTGNLLIPMEGIWRRSFDRLWLPLWIVLEPPLLMGPLPHLSDPPSGIDYMWKWAYSLQ